jgi:hypothetical protein
MRTEQFRWSADTGWAPQFRAELGPAAQLVLLFGDLASVQASSALEAARKAYPSAHILGCSTGGEIQGNRVYDGSVVLTAVAFDQTRVAVGQVPVRDADGSFEAGARIGGILPPEGLRHVFLVSDGLNVNSSDLVEGMNSTLPPGVTASGGFAADSFRFQSTQVWCDGPPRESSVAVLGFYGERLRVGLAATAGWDTFGLDRLITRSRKNVLYEFDGRPALALYKQYLGDAGRELPASGLLYPLGLRVGGMQDRVLRTILATNEPDQSITFAGNIPEGGYARLMRGNIEHLIDAAAAAAQESTAALPGTAPQLALLVSCNGRRPVLKQRIEEEVEAANEAFGEHTTVAGFYSYGEIAPVGSGPAQLHNETMTVLTFAEI